MSSVADIPGGPLVFVLEDEWLIGEATARSLQRIGCRPLGPARTVGEALDSLTTEAPDAALIDTKLGSVSALPVVDRIIELGIPFAFVTGFQRDELPARYAAYRLLSKPFTERQLEALIRDLLKDRSGAPSQQADAMP